MPGRIQRFRTVIPKERQPLIIEFQIAVAVYELTRVKREKVWFNKLVEVMKGRASRQLVSKAVKHLLEWRILRVEYGETQDGRQGKLLLVHEDSIKAIRRMRLLEKRIREGKDGGEKHE